MKMTLDQHSVYVTTVVPHEEDKLVCLEISAPNRREVVVLTLTGQEAVALVRALDGAVDETLTYNYMGGRTP